MRENVGICVSVMNRPAVNESYAIRVDAKVCPSTSTRCPVNRNPPPTPTTTSTASSATWNSRFPVSRR